MVLAYDFLDVMAWDVALSGFLLSIGALILPHEEGSSFVNEKAGLRKGFAVAGGGAGFYLFLSGLMISFSWPLTLANGVYNILFGGVATLGGLVLLTGSIILFFNANQRPVSYFAAVVGLYAVVDAYAIMNYSLTSAPVLSALSYLSFAAPAFLSVPATHLKNKWWKGLFIIFSILFAIAWLYEAANFTFAHLNPS
jgi:uncharacterized membrane protein